MDPVAIIDVLFLIRGIWIQKVFLTTFSCPSLLHDYELKVIETLIVFKYVVRREKIVFVFMRHGADISEFLCRA
jgi:hypothetical protein